MTLLAHEHGVPRVVEDDPWVVMADGATIDESQDVIVALEEVADAKGIAGGRLGVKVAGDADPEALVPHLTDLALVVIELPKFTDGRAYSLARLLRDQHGYEGELRATGAVLRDQLFYMARVGFDSFELADGVQVEDALAAFRDFSETYQPAEDHDQPIWKRRRSNS